LLGKVPVSTTDEFSLSASFKEAIAFAVLAYWRNLCIPGNLPAVTGASQEVLLGEIHGNYG
jgi:anhydro-N-acetylmuramic acid kinase